MTVPETTLLPGEPVLPADQATLQTEAARYTVLRRLAPCLRHHMVRPLQPIGLIYGVLHHKLAADQPDLPSVRQEAEKINEFAKAALEECMDMGTWLAPEPGVLTDVASSVKECMGLLATMLHFCGFRLVNEVEALPALVLRDAMRMVLSAALLEMTDAMSEPATVTIEAQASLSEVTVLLQAQPLGEGELDRYDDGYRKLAWADVQALARSEHVGLSRQDGQVTLRFAVEQAPAD